MAAGVAGALGEQRDPQRVLARPLAGDARALRARGDVDAGRGDREQRLGDVGRVEAAGERDRHLAGDRGGELDVDPGPGPARVRAAGGVEQDPRRRRRRGTRARRAMTASGRVPGGHAERLPRRPAGGRDRGRRLVAVELHDVGVERRDDLREAVRGQVRRDEDDLRARTRRAPPSGRAGRAPRPPRAAARAACPGAKLRPDGVGARRGWRRGCPASSVTPQIFT